MEKPNNITDNDWKLLKSKYKNLKPIIKKINKDYPVQYLIGNVNFYGYNINVNKNVLIPRFETETLVEKTINYIKKLKLTNSSLLEVGTGSGCISIVLKKELDGLKITSLDISKKALKVANKNAKLNNADINFINCDIFKYKPINKYDILISNPPYVKETDDIDNSIKYEPKNAIFDNENGLKYYKRMLELGKTFLNKKNLIAFEISYNMSKVLKDLAKEYYPKSKILVEKDLSNKNRYLFIINE